MKEDKAATDEAVFGDESKAYMMSIINQENAALNANNSVSTIAATAPTCPSAANALSNASTTTTFKSAKA